MKNRMFFGVGIAAALLAIVLGFGACDNLNGATDATYTVTADGEDTTTTKLTFAFSEAVTGLTAENITLTNDTGAATKGGLTGSGTNWTLAVTDIATGTITVKIAKDGIEDTAKTVTVYKEGQPEPGAYTVTANGGADAATTALTFAFGEAVTGLTAENITLTNGTGAATKGGLTGSGTSWTLAVTVSAAGNITVAIAKDGIAAEAKTVTVYGQAEPVSVTATSLQEAFSWLTTNAEEGKAYDITLQGNETIAPKTLLYAKTVGITILGGTSERTISLSGAGSLFTVGSKATLTLGANVSLQGRSDNTEPLVKVASGGALVMNAGSKISGNTNSRGNFSSSGGGVSILSGGRFTMNGGEISGNSVVTSGGASSSGGGVYVAGTFAMKGGVISNNSASSSNAFPSGGGVYILGTFTMEGGEISGNSVSSSASSPRSSGGGVFVVGTFTMKDGKISGNSANYSGGGVSVNDGLPGGSMFTMEGGEISGNSANYSGGGVFVYYNQTFTMKGGVISGNSANSGGGVFVDSFNNDLLGKFTKQSGGTIYGSDASDAALKNTATNSGHAVYVDASPARTRAATAGSGATLDSAKAGSAGGWE